jgi:predicted O-methyltransferase YrrM
MKLYTNDFTGNLQTSLQFFKELQKSIEVSKQEFHVLEIGCFEGRGTNLLFDTFCKFNEKSSITCVDPFLDSYTLHSQHFSTCDFMFRDQYFRFQKNVEHLGSQCKVLRGLSTHELPKLNDEIFDFIYVDGDHHKDIVYLDAVNAFQKLKKNGIVVFDDYTWLEHENGPKDAVDRFLREYKDNIIVLFVNLQVAVQKK